MKKYTALLLALAVLLSACGSFSHIPDTNGDADTSLCSITPEELTARSVRVLEQNTMRSTSNGRTSFRTQKLSGITEICRFTGQENDDCVFTVRSAVTSGNLKLYFYSDGKILYDIPAGQTVTVTLPGMQGQCALRAAGESAAFSVEIVPGA